MHHYEENMKGKASGADAGPLAQALLEKLGLSTDKNLVESVEMYDCTAGVKLKVTLYSGSIVAALGDFDYDSASFIFTDAPPTWLNLLLSCKGDEPVYVSITALNLVYFTSGEIKAATMSKADFASFCKLIIAALPKFTRV